VEGGLRLGGTRCGSSLDLLYVFCMVIEDSPAGVTAACRARVPLGGWTVDVESPDKLAVGEYVH
jgi:beta-phosphoglucomutase-like phosphatase (HAD superfamily)